MFPTDPESTVISKNILDSEYLWMVDSNFQYNLSVQPSKSNFFHRDCALMTFSGSNCAARIKRFATRVAVWKVGHKAALMTNLSLKIGLANQMKNFYFGRRLSSVWCSDHFSPYKKAYIQRKNDLFLCFRKVLKDRVVPEGDNGEKNIKCSFSLSS